MKRTYQPSKRKHVKVHGFRARMATVSGRKVLARRRSKGRAVLSAQETTRLQWFFVMVKTMKKINRLLSNLDFQKLIKNSKSFSNKSYIVFYHKNQIDHIRIGISVSTKLGGAVARNKIKRQVRMMLNQTIDLNLKKDIVIIVKSGYATNTYIKNKEELITLFKKINEVA